METVAKEELDDKEQPNAWTKIAVFLAVSAAISMAVGLAATHGRLVGGAGYGLSSWALPALIAVLRPDKVRRHSWRGLIAPTAILLVIIALQLPQVLR